MSGTCDTCANRESCHKDIGIIFGFCNADYKPADNESKSKEEQNP